MSTQKGRHGEQLAAQYLIKNNYQILDLNVYSYYGEIDIIATDSDGMLVFIEVKTFKKDALIDARQVITARKQRNLIATAKYFLLKTKLELDCRFDLIAITTPENQINHYENIITIGI